MTRRDSLQCVHEPFGDAFYYGPERLSHRYEEDEEARLASGFSQTTYKTVFDRIERESTEVRKAISFYATQTLFFAFYYSLPKFPVATGHCGSCESCRVGGVACLASSFVAWLRLAASIRCSSTLWPLPAHKEKEKRQTNLLMDTTALQYSPHLFSLLHFAVVSFWIPSLLCLSIYRASVFSSKTLFTISFHRTENLQALLHLC